MKLPKLYGKWEHEQGMHAFEDSYTFHFESGAIMYVTNNIKDGSPMNYANRLLIGHQSYHKNHILDTITVAGQDEGSKYWRESLLGEIAVGYLSVDIQDMASFDQAVASLTRAH